MGGEAKLTGPDLVEGVPLADLPEGKPFAAHAHGEAVVVVKRGASLRMIGGTCTHYGAPLADGLVVGDTIRCPWHHACFDLETGEARGAPALSAIACHDVVVRDGRAFIGSKKDFPHASKHASAPDSIVVLGAGAAGAAAVEQLRTRGYSGSITMVGDELPGPVDRPNLSKDYLAGNAPEEWVTLRDASFYAGIDVTLIIGDAATAIDKAASTVTLASGKVLHYGALLLATGAEPIRLPIPGADLPHVFTLRSLADSRAIIEQAASAKRAVVIGSSFIGLEAAASLRARGLEVDVVGRDALPLENILGSELGAFVQKLHEEHGVRFHLKTSPRAITSSSVELDGGAALPADLVVMGVGVRPRTALAEKAGLTVDKGVVVDASLKTSERGIWAAGDIARYPDPRTGELIRIEHFALAERQGQAAARSMLGGSGAFRDVPFFWSAHYDVTISYVGYAGGWDHVEVRGDLAAKDAAVVYSKAGKPLAVATIGRDLASLRVEAALEDGDDAEVLRALSDG
jgi:NADPH-dependent 2,4-dienoyl-CoA reductase/sulfur reductase-like enzyme/nitrite reductase/ring-hydroxylating ferredoxin subunit